MNEIRFRAQTPKDEAKDLQLRLQVVLGDSYEVVLETKNVTSMSGHVSEDYYIVIKKSTEDFKRGVSHGLK